MSPGLRKLALSFHVIASVGLLGAIAAFLALSSAGLAGHDPQTARAVYPAMALIARRVVMPLTLAALATGLIQSLGTAWGLFRHYWVLIKLLMTLFATAVLLVKLDLIDQAARLASETILPRADLRVIGIQLLVHAAGGLLVLLVPAVLSIYKPQGLTRYGTRRRHALSPP
jgi:hypothetical protein